MNNFSGLWAIEAVTSCLVPGPGMIRAEEYCLLECKSQIEAVVQILALDWFVCIRKAPFWASHLLSLRTGYRKEEDVVNTLSRLKLQHQPGL